MFSGILCKVADLQESEGETERKKKGARVGDVREDDDNDDDVQQTSTSSTDELERNSRTNTKDSALSLMMRMKQSADMRLHGASRMGRLAGAAGRNSSGRALASQRSGRRRRPLARCGGRGGVATVRVHSTMSSVVSVHGAAFVRRSWGRAVVACKCSLVRGVEDVAEEDGSASTVGDDRRRDGDGDDEVALITSDDTDRNGKAEGSFLAQENENTNTEGLRRQQRFAIAGLTVAVVMLSLSNRVLNKLAMVSMRSHIFFMAQVQTLCFVGFYGSTLFLRTKVKKVVTPEMLSVPKLPFVAIGLLDCMSQTFGFIGSSKLPGIFLPILSQVYILCLLPLSMVFLKRKYTLLQLFGASMIGLGVALSALSGKFGEIWQMMSGGLAHSQVVTSVSGSGVDDVLPVFFACTMVSQMMSALSTVVKEKVFKRFEESQTKRAACSGEEDSDSDTTAPTQKLDIFIVNTFGSTMQMFFALLLLPLNAHLRGIPIGSIPQLFMNSAAAFAGRGGSHGAPLYPVMYLAVNIIFNIATLTLTRSSSGVLTSIAVSTSVPLSVLIFAYVSLPVIGASNQAVGPEFFVGLIVLMTGLVIYNAGPRIKQSMLMLKAKKEL